MRGHCRVKLAAVVIGTDGLQGDGIDFEGRVPLLHHQEFTPVPDTCGVGEAVLVVEDKFLEAGLAVEWVHGVDHGLLVFLFQLELGGANPSVAVAHLAVFDMKGVGHAVTGKEVVVAPGRELLVGAAAVEGAAQIPRYFTLDR